ncbi:hypothetical protein GTQ43_25775 [Nostoc sp. KVJ3]|nr:hypothetical protein [Nostoc sp. KVJ3]
MTNLPILLSVCCHIQILKLQHYAATLTTLAQMPISSFERWRCFARRIPLANSLNS